MKATLFGIASYYLFQVIPRIKKNPVIDSPSSSNVNPVFGEPVFQAILLDSVWCMHSIWCCTSFLKSANVLHGQESAKLSPEQGLECSYLGADTFPADQPRHYNTELSLIQKAEVKTIAFQAFWGKTYNWKFI